MKRLNLKTKIGLSTFIIFFSVVPLVAWTSLTYSKGRLRQAIEAQQATLVAVVAGELDEKIRTAQDTLVKTAEVVSTDIISNPARAEAFLHSRPALNNLFDSNLVLFTATGTLIAETAQEPSRTGMDFSYRDYVKKTLSTGMPFISEPFTSQLPHHHPVLAFTAPVRGKDGTMVAILAGGIDLMRPNFLGKLATDRLGRTGYFYLFNTSRTMILHPDPARIMKNDVPPGSNLRFDKAIKDGDNVGETVNSRGLRVLAAFKRLKTTNWILAVNFPTSEAYEPIKKDGLVLFWIVISGGLFIVVVMWLIMRHLSLPILSLTDQIRHVEDYGGLQQVVVRSGDEIEELAETFNGLMQRLKNEEERLSYMSSHDVLTGLYNRTFFEVELERLRVGREFPVSVVMADLDGLKSVNDTLGHASGDAMIRAAAEILLEAVRAGDIVARIGGDEFAILLPRTDEEAVGKALERIRSCETIRRQAIHEYDFAMSLGAATAMDGDQLNEAFKAADQRMYQDKAKRRTAGH
jgi:diguanylate cyclase (GGDEF)-like protein